MKLSLFLAFSFIFVVLYIVDIFFIPCLDDHAMAKELFCFLVILHNHCETFQVLKRENESISGAGRRGEHELCWSGVPGSEMLGMMNVSL